MAVKERVQVVGINDFYSMSGYEEWNNECLKRNLYPLFNIEFIALDEAYQQQGIRVNDPSNPGRTYLSGKGMAYPVKLAEPYASQLAEVVKESNDQVKAMCGKLNLLLKEINAGFTLNILHIEKELTKGSVRERHLAKALRLEAYRHLENDSARIALFFETLFGGKALKSAVEDVAGVENEIRGNLLKAGGAAFVPETPAAFLPVETVRSIILNAGGIPTYPFLADDAKGGYTDFEAPLEKTMKTLRERGFWSVEFITTRNGVDLLEQYVTTLWEAGFVVTLGSEHNTPAMEPITLFARHATPLSPRLQEINYWGACIVAAHQDRVSKGKQGYLDKTGSPNLEERKEYVKYGDSIIRSIIG